MFKYLFSPITINKLTVKNRIAYPSLGLLFSYDGKLNDRYVNFYLERAAGGAGIVTVGPVGVDFIGSGMLCLSISDDSAVEPFSRLTRAMKDKGTSPFIQLFHAGRYSHPILINNETPLGPSPVFSPYSKVTPREMTKEDIRTVQKAFAAGAARAKKAGFDGIEIIGSAGYLICQFLSPLTNVRTDEYGGCFENRTRFAVETIQMCREAVGPDHALTIRMAGNDFVPGSNTEEDSAAIARVYEAAGIDAIDVTGGWHETRVPQLPMDLPRAGYAFLALNVKKAVSVPVFASNRIAAPEDAERILADGYADLVNLGRVLIADPEWPLKAKEGRADEIRPCVACNQGCTDRIFTGQPVFCVGNPRAGYEAERVIPTVLKPKKILVAGAGPGGLEAAVTAARAGHDVSLYEKAAQIGGQLWVAGAPPHKNELWEFARYYRAMIYRTGVKLFLNTEVTADLIRREAPDHVIVAEGAEPLVPPIRGVNDPSVVGAWEVLSENPLLGKEVAVVGGGAVGLETAMFVAHKGTLNPEVVHFLLAYEAMDPARIRKLMFAGSTSVTVFEMLDRAGKDVGRSTKWVLFDNLRRFHVDVKTSAKVLSIENGVLAWEKDGKTESKKFDQVILASGSRPRQKLSKVMETLGVPFSAIGDCRGIGRIQDAVHGGFLAALALSA